MAQTTPAPIIVWFRSDLRVHDNLALAKAAQNTGTIVPVFVLDERHLKGDSSSPNRNRFLYECLADLKQSLRKIGGDLIIREGDPSRVLVELAKEVGAQAVYYTADYSPYAIRRDKNIENALVKSKIEFRGFSGILAVHSLQKIMTKSGTPYKVFSPFWKAWQEVQRRDVVEVPKKITIPRMKAGSIPSIASLSAEMLSKTVVKGGESEARRRLKEFLINRVDLYNRTNNSMDVNGTSRLSSYLHFGCLSVREVETLLHDSAGAKAWHRQLAWRDFYYYILFHFPHPEQEFQERYRTYKWVVSSPHFKAWTEGKTGYPAVDAAMRQLKEEGWMHNRGRLIVGSFLTKDLGIDWREGERHFMRWLLDGDIANNNGNWQWIASVGVDQAPVFRRLYNPSSQRDKYDVSGEYVRKYLPELKYVADKHLSEPWKMSKIEQKESRCVIGKDYPYPIVDHKEARAVALERYRSASAG